MGRGAGGRPREPWRSCRAQVCRGGREEKTWWKGNLLGSAVELERSDAWASRRGRMTADAVHGERWPTRRRRRGRPAGGAERVETGRDGRDRAHVDRRGLARCSRRPALATATKPRLQQQAFVCRPRPPHGRRAAAARTGAARVRAHVAPPPRGGRRTRRRPPPTRCGSVTGANGPRLPATLPSRQGHGGGRGRTAPQRRHPARRAAAAASLQATARTERLSVRASVAQQILLRTCSVLGPESRDFW